MAYVPRNAKYEKKVNVGDIDALAVTTAKINNNAVTYAKVDSTLRTYKMQMRHAVAEATAATDFEKTLGVATYAGTVTSVKFIPDAGFGQNTNYATISVINKGQAGAGSTSVASKDYTAANAATAYVPSAVTLSVTPANLVVAAGDILTFKKTHTASGQLLPVGKFELTIERSA